MSVLLQCFCIYKGSLGGPFGATRFGVLNTYRTLTLEGMVFNGGIINSELFCEGHRVLFCEMDVLKIGDG